MTYQVIRYNPKALVCRDQIKSLGYFDSKTEAKYFAENVENYGLQIIVRKIATR